MNRFFWDWLLPLTLSGTLSAALLLLADRLPARYRSASGWQYRAALAGLLLFLIPIRLPLVSQFLETEGALPAPITAVLAPMVAQQGWAALTVSSLYLVPGALLGWLWLMGVLIGFLMAMGTTMSFQRMLRRACRPVTDPALLGLFEDCRQECGVRRHITLLRCAGIGSPALTGLLRPRILIDETPLSDRELRFVLLHELTHYKHGDLIWRHLALGVRILHWFNPLARSLANSVTPLGEMACDAAMTRRMPLEERREYSVVLLDLIGRAQGTPLVAASFSQGKDALKKRLMLILEPCCTTRGKILTGGILCIALLLGMFVSALLAPSEQMSVGIIGGADGPTAIFLARKPSFDTENQEPPASLPQEQGATALIEPVENGLLSAGFQEYVGHTGLDYICETGTPVRAAASGIVKTAEYVTTGYGNTVVLDHGGGLETLYAHNSKLLVKDGDWVEQGQLVAESGRSGNATGPHCHFELLKDGIPIDPTASWSTEQ